MLWPQSWDAKEAIQPDTSRASVVTFVRDTLERRVNCTSRWADNCDLDFEDVSKVAFNIRDVEDYSLVMDHSFESKLVFSSSMSGMSLQGTLVCDNGAQKPFQRFVLLSEFLTCAGISSLDDASDEPVNPRRKSKRSRSTYRQRGVVLHVRVEYTNLAHSWIWPGPVQYFVKVDRMEHVGSTATTVTPAPGSFTALDPAAVKLAFPKLTDDQLQTLSDPALEHRIVRKTSAVHLALEQGGKLGKFTVASCVTALVTVTALFNMPFIVVDFLLFFLSYVDVAEEHGTPKHPEKVEAKHEYVLVGLARCLRALRRWLDAPSAQLQPPAPESTDAATNTSPGPKTKAAAGKKEARLITLAGLGGAVGLVGLCFLLNLLRYVVLLCWQCVNSLMRQMMSHNVTLLPVPYSVTRVPLARVPIPAFCSYIC